MGCFGRLFGRRKKRDSETFEQPIRPHKAPASNGNGFPGEKPGYAAGRTPAAAAHTTSPVPNAVAHNQQHMAQTSWATSPASTQMSDMTMSSTINGFEAGTDPKHKDDDLDDPAAKERARKAEEARIKAEKEEQERLDFLQWM